MKDINMKDTELSLWEIRVHKETRGTRDKAWLSTEYVIGIVQDSTMPPTFHFLVSLQLRRKTDNDYSGIYVGSEWLKKNLTNKEFADYIRWRMEGSK